MKKTILAFMLVFLLVTSPASAWLLPGYGYDQGKLKASEIATDTSNFDGNLSADEITVQLALDALDDLTISGTFLGLTDTPSAYTGQTGLCSKVNAGETALEFGVCGAAGAGEANTASNTGSAGVGLFKQKTALDLEFYKIASANNRLTAALSGTDYFLLTLVEANIDHDALANFLSGEHFTMLDEDDMATDSNTQAATQQSIKAYVDGQVHADFAQTVTVAKSGGDFTVIQSAIDSIADAASNKQYVVLVYPGIYTENVVMEDYVSLKGETGVSSSVLITNSSGTVLTADTGSDNTVINIGIAATGTAEALNLPVGMGTNRLILQNSTISGTYGAHADDLIVINSGTLIFNNTQAIYYSTGGATTHRVFHAIGAATQLFFVNSSAIVNIDDTGSNDFSMFEFDSGSNMLVDIAQSSLISDCEMTGGTQTVYKDLDANGITGRNFKLNSNVVMLGEAGATGQIFTLDNVATTLRSANNSMVISGFGTNLLANIGAAATLVSNFDEVIGVTIDSEVAGTGTYDYVNIPEDNVLAISDFANVDKALRLKDQSVVIDAATGKIGLYSFNSGGNDTTDTELLLHFDVVGSGNPVNDAFGAGIIDTTNQGTTQQATTAKFLPAALQLDAVDTEWVAINNMWATDAGGWAFDWWAQADDLSTVQPMLSAGDGTGNNFMMFQIKTDGKVKFVIENGGAEVIKLESGKDDFVDDAWNHVRVERTGDNYYLYVGGIFKKSDTWVGGDPAGLTAWEIGRNDPENSANYFDGFIDEMKIYMDEDQNFNGSDFSIPSVPYDSPTLWSVDESGNRVALIGTSTSTGTGSFWNKLVDDSLVYSVGDLNRFIIPPQAADNATNGMRSLIVNGTFQDVGDETSAYSCDANGFDAIPCDTSGSGADFGVQGSIEIQGTGIYLDGSTEDTNETKLTVTDPTADRTVTFGDLDLLFNQSVESTASPTFVQVTSPTIVIDLLDTAGAADIDYGSGDVTDHTFTSDGGVSIIDGSLSSSGGSTVAGSLILKEDTDDGANFYTIKGVATAADLSWILPATNGTAGQVLEIASVSSNELTLEWDDDGGAAGGGGLALQLDPKSAKLPSSNPMGIDAGNNQWRGLFDDTTDECARWQFMATPFNAGTINVEIGYTLETTSSSDVVEMEVYFMAVTSGDAADVDTDSFDTVNNFSSGSVSTTAGYLNVLTGTISNDDSLAEDDLLIIKVCRDADDTDTTADDVELRGIAVYE